MQIQIFLELSGEFVNTQIDNKNDKFENFQDIEENEEETAENKKLKNTLGGKYAIQLKKKLSQGD